MRSAFAYRPTRGPLQTAALGPALAYLGAPCLVAFVYQDPIVLSAAALAVVLAGLAAGAAAALRQSLRWALWLGAMIVAINLIATDRGLTLLVRGPHVPVLGSLDVTLEALVAGGVLALRILVVGLAFGVYSACVDPDRVLRALRRVARRSALTASLIARMVPVMSADAARLREAAKLRGPAAAPVERGALIRRLVAGSLDRAVDVAATLELRGYSARTPSALGPPARGSPTQRRFLAAGLLIAIASLGVRLAGEGKFEAYPSVSIDFDLAALVLAATLPVAALAPFAGLARGGAPRRG
jgi:energy-coupling factor transport system permease protein